MSPLAAKIVSTLYISFIMEAITSALTNVMPCVLAILNLLICPSFNPGVGNRPVITYAHLSQVDRVA